MIGPLTVAADLDGCLYDHVNRVLLYLRMRWNTIIPIQEVHTRNMCQLTNSSEINQDIAKQIHNPEFYLDMKVMPGAREALYRLARIAKLVVISNRPTHLKQTTELCLARDFPNKDLTRSIFSSVHLVKSVPKWRRAQQLGARYAIEDNPDIAEQYAEHRICCFLLGSGSGYRPSRYVKGVSSLSEVADWLDGQLGVCTRPREAIYA